MDKKEFLSALRDALSVLSEEELQDILNEYEQHIDMKVASGLTEEEAIADFGDFQELTTELLEAYHVRVGTEPAEPKTEGSAGEQVLGGIRSVGAGLSGILVSAVEWHWRNLKNLWNWLCKTVKTTYGWFWTTAKTFCGWLWRTAKDAGGWLWKTVRAAMAWIRGIVVMAGGRIRRAFQWCRRQICRPFVWLTTRGTDAGDDLLSDEEMRMEGIQVEGMQMEPVDDSGAAEPMEDQRKEAVQGHGEAEAGQAVYGTAEASRSVYGTAEASQTVYGTEEASQTVYGTAEAAVSAAYGVAGQEQAAAVQEWKATGQEQAGVVQEMRAAGQEQEGSVREWKAAGQEQAWPVRELEEAGQDQAAAGANGTAASAACGVEKIRVSTRESEIAGRKRVDGSRTEPASVAQEKKGKRRYGLLRRFCRGIAAIVRWCRDVCLWWIRLAWNVFCIGICICIGIMGAVVLFLLGMCLVLVFDGYPLGGVEIILTGMTVCFFTLAGFILTLIRRKNRGGGPGKKSGSTTVEGERAAIEPAAKKKMTMRRWRIILTVGFFIGVLLGGAGTGVLFVEWSSLRYNGEKIFGEENLVTEDFDFRMKDDGSMLILDSGYYENHYLEGIEEDSDVPEGVVRYRVTYNGSLCRPRIIYNRYDREETEEFPLATGPDAETRETEDPVGPDVVAGEAEDPTEPGAETGEAEDPTEPDAKTRETESAAEPKPVMDGTIFLALDRYGDGWELVMENKDEVLEDLKQGKLFDYRIVDVTNVQIRINPATMARVENWTGRP